MSVSPYRAPAGRPSGTPTSREPSIALILVFGVLVWIIIAMSGPHRSPGVDQGAPPPTHAGVVTHARH